MEISLDKDERANYFPRKLCHKVGLSNLQKKKFYESMRSAFFIKTLQVFSEVSELYCKVFSYRYYLIVN